MSSPAASELNDTPTRSDANRVLIFDTTLRDGEQSAGAALRREQKLQLAKQLAKLRVDVIEAGFPFSSPEDFESVRTIAAEVEGPIICALSRATKPDIDAAWDAIRVAKRPRIHTFIATSDIHIAAKFKKTRDEILQIIREMVGYAASKCVDVEFSAEDAGRTEPFFLYKVLETAIDAGATTVNIPDTVGYTLPEEFGGLIRKIVLNVPNIERAVISTHCHDDLGMATANSLMGVRNGARQVECTINGLGERAGNAALEEIVMALRVREPFFEGAYTAVATEHLYETSQLVSGLTQMVVQPNKAVVGDNAFAHESGIHQDGFLKGRQTYEIMAPEMVGNPGSKLPLGPRSGRSALKARMAAIGLHPPDERMGELFQAFKLMADEKRRLSDDDLRALYEQTLAAVALS
ncbi:MAG: 2-isopropylmalate synthase [Candidatus Melainabacteria bacterium]|nr:2-isopropylmalate synthase [Candidatus Melainabacteria bacterium]